MVHVVEPPKYNTSLADSHGSQWEHFGTSLSGNHLHIKRAHGTWG